MRIISFLLLLSCFATEKLFAQSSPMAMVSTIPSTRVYKVGGPGSIKCLVHWSLLKNGKNMKIFFYAQSDVRNIPMQLTIKGADLPIKKTVEDKTYYAVFSPAMKDIFYKTGAASKYKWKWQGAAKAPASPIADGNPKMIKYWFKVQVDGAAFSTEPTYIDVK